jgi:two-component system, LytTR family, sensor histidine kinase AlgZ
MKDSQILSAFHELAPEAPPPPVQRLPVFDACRVGVALRAVLFVETVVAVGAMYGAYSFPDWLTRLSLLTGAALPATVFWLVAACGLKRPLARLPERAQYTAGVLLGALSGVYGCGMMTLAGLLLPAPWLASAFTGALLSAALVAALALRARGRTPAATAARLTELQSRIRPHFLFNTLNSAIALVRAEPARAEALLEDLSDLFRHALVDQGESVTLAEEITLAQRYLDIEQARFGERLRVEWSLDPQADAAQLPPLLLQPLVENAVLHGVEPSPNGAQIRISTQRRGSTVVIKVTNTVPNGQGAHGHGVALGNVRDRLSLLHDVQGRFQTILKDGIYQVRIEVPV